MLVYGDRVTIEEPGAKLAAIDAALTEAGRRPVGIERHAVLVGAFIEAAELLQGIADREFEALGCDRRFPAQHAATGLVMALAAAVDRSWTSGFSGDLPRLDLRNIEAAIGDGVIATRLAEGYAFYAIYPEAFLFAARRARLPAPVTVIGIRSIGAGLGAMVATALAAPPPVTVRPIGHPFRRELALTSDLAAALKANVDGAFAVVDEGPGLSGSSFGAVADWLEDRGVSGERIHFFPSHAGEPGAEANPRHRTRWAGAARHVVDVDALVLHATRPMHRLESWVADLTGPARRPLDDISGGAWRRHRFADEARWPPSWAQQERRKFLLHADGGAWLLKFAGLGRAAAAKHRRAQMLAEAGFVNTVNGHRHGFLVERWLTDAGPLDPHKADRASLVRQVGRYLGFRARSFPADAQRGASPAELLEMARRNVTLSLGEPAARPLSRWADLLDRLERSMRRIETDNRMHSWEWLQSADGRILKTDALDHHAAHDLIGCQDVAWDVLGAAVELDLTPAEQERLCDVIERESGRAVDREVLAFLTPCYLAFQLGSWTLAADSAGWPQEKARCEAAVLRYRQRLANGLEGGSWLA